MQDCHITEQLRSFDTAAQEAQPSVVVSIAKVRRRCDEWRRRRTMAFGVLTFAVCGTMTWALTHRPAARPTTATLATEIAKLEAEVARLDYELQLSEGLMHYASHSDEIEARLGRQYVDELSDSLSVEVGAETLLFLARHDLDEQGPAAAGEKLSLILDTFGDSAAAAEARQLVDQLQM